MVGLAAVGSKAGFGISVSILLELKGYKPLAFHPARIFLLIKALSLAGLYR